MKGRSIAALASLALGSVFSLGAHQAVAQSSPQYITGLAHGVKAVLWKPDGNPSSHTGVIVIHRTSNYLAHPACSNLSQRGFTVLCMNSRFDNNETLVNFELLAQDVGVGVNYLKQTLGMTHVILLGHSGGGPTTTFYQAVAVNGTSYCQGQDKLSECASSGANSLAGLTPADGIVLLDAHPSIAVNLLRGIDPSIKQNQDSETVGVGGENKPIKRDEKLDMFNPANGFNASGQSNYSKSFQQKYTTAEAQRMNDWIDQAQHEQALIAEGNWRFPDDDSIIFAAAGGSVAGGGNEAALFKPDTNIPTQCCTTQTEQVLTNSGAVITEKYTTVRQPDPSDFPGILSFDTGTKNLTVTSFLTANAIRSSDALDYNQIQWCSTNDSVPCALQSIKTPILMFGMGAYYFFPDMEQYFLHYSASPDKTFLVADGLVHGLTPCGNCPGGPYTNMENNLWNYIGNWIKVRFGQ
jgi:hypothetical protein